MALKKLVHHASYTRNPVHETAKQNPKIPE